MGDALRVGADLAWSLIFVVLALIVLFFVLLRAILRAHRTKWFGKSENTCRKCGYDLRGNVSGICPECGSPTLGNSRPTDSQ